MNFDLTLSPAQIEYVLKPGAVFTHAYEVENKSDNTLYLLPSVSPFSPSGIDGQVDYDQVLPLMGIEFNLQNTDAKLGQVFVLPPHQKKQLVLKIKAAPDVKLEDSYFTFFISQNEPSPSANGQSQSRTIGKIGSHILLSFSDSESQSVKSQIKDFTVTPKFKDILLSRLEVKALVQNTSLYFFKSSGKLTITKGDRVIKEFPLYPDNVLKNHSRRLRCAEILSDNTTLPVPCRLAPPFWPGQYTATIKLDSELETSSSSINFYIFPLSALLPLIFLAVSFYLLSRYRLKNKAKN